MVLTKTNRIDSIDEQLKLIKTNNETNLQQLTTQLENPWACTK